MMLVFGLILILLGVVWLSREVARFVNCADRRLYEREIDSDL